MAPGQTAPERIPNGISSTEALRATADDAAGRRRGGHRAAAAPLDGRHAALLAADHPAQRHDDAAIDCLEVQLADGPDRAALAGVIEQHVGASPAASSGIEGDKVHRPALLRIADHRACPFDQKQAGRIHADAAGSHAPHRRVGNRLAELQLQIIWGQILKRFPVIEVQREPRRVYSTFIKGYEDLPVVIPSRV